MRFKGSLKAGGMGRVGDGDLNYVLQTSHQDEDNLLGLCHNYRPAVCSSSLLSSCSEWIELHLRSLERWCHLKPAQNNDNVLFRMLTMNWKDWVDFDWPHGRWFWLWAHRKHLRGQWSPQKMTYDQHLKKRKNFTISNLHGVDLLNWKSLMWWCSHCILQFDIQRSAESRRDASFEFLMRSSSMHRHLQTSMQNNEICLIMTNH